MKNEEGVNCGNMYLPLPSCVSLDAVIDSLHLALADILHAGIRTSIHLQW